MAAHFSSASEQQFFPSFLSDLNARTELVTALQRIVREAMDLFALDDCSVALLDTEGARLLILANAHDDQTEMTSPVPLEDLLAPLLTEHTPLLLPAAPFDGCLQPLGEGLTCVLACFPLLDQDQLLGIFIARSATFAPGDARQMRLLTLLAEQAALVMVNVRRMEQLQAAERAKAAFLSLVTHELRSPLNSINGYLDLTLDGLAGELNEQQQEFIERARGGSEYLYTLLEDLLLAARADAGLVRLKREPVVLEDLVSDVRDGFDLLVRDTQVSLEVKIPSEFPLLNADSSRLQQVIRNLLGNAARNTPAGGLVTLAARVLPEQAASGKELVEISVCDTGYGISAEYHERIFERFFRLPSVHSARISGLGLGLTAVKLIVELHGGSVRVESTPDAGSTFFITLDAL